MSHLTTDLRLIASAVEVQADALQRLTFCARAYLRSQVGEGAMRQKQAREQLVDALKLAEAIVGQS